MYRISLTSKCMLWIFPESGIIQISDARRTWKLWENFHSPLDLMQVNRLQWVAAKYFCNISTTKIDWVIQWIRSTKIDRIAIYPMHRLWGNFLVLLPFDICSTKWHTVPLVNLAELPQSAQVQVWFSRSLWCPPCQESAPALSLPHPIGYRNPWGWIPVKGINLRTKAGVLLFLFFVLSAVWSVSQTDSY